MPDTPPADDQPLLTLTEVSERTGISMPTLGRYKKEHQDRIPSVGEGRTQRYPVEALAVFQQIKKENLKKRGRPKSTGTDESESSPAADTDLLTLTEVADRTDISYPTLIRYVKLHRDRIPFEGEGRRKRYHPEAVEVFQEIYSEGKGGRRRKSTAGTSGPTAAPSLARRVSALERTQARLERELNRLTDELDQPLTVTIKRQD